MRIYLVIIILVISNFKVIPQSNTNNLSTSQAQNSVPETFGSQIPTFDFPKLNSLQPIEPTTASLGRYGEYKMDNSSGQPNISIPLYEIVSGDLKIPLVLNYQSGGIKVSQEATWVGLGWDLFYGGQVTRVVNGFPDEHESTDRPNALDIMDYMDNNPSPFDYYLQLLSSDQSKYSFMPDEYYYNIGLEHGKYIGKDVEALIPYKPVKIKSSEDQIAIADANGTVFSFGAGEVTKPLTADHIYPTYTSAWYLDEIRSANNHTIRYNYQYDGEYNGIETGYYEGYKLIKRSEGISVSSRIIKLPLTKASGSQRVTSYKPGVIYFNGGRISFELTSREDMGNSSSLKKLSNITIEVMSNNTYVLFKKILFDYSYKGNRLFLDKVTEIANDDATKIIAEFEYNNTLLPKKESFNYDYCGYYNGSNNGTPIAREEVTVGYQTWVIGGADKSTSPTGTQAGVLTAIKHPTGGKTIYKWGNHRYGEGQPIDHRDDEPTRNISVAGVYDESLLAELGHSPSYHLRDLPDPHPYGITEYICDRSQTAEVTYCVAANEIADQSMHQKYDRGGVGIIDKTTNEVLLDYHIKATTTVKYQTQNITFKDGHTYLIYGTVNCPNVAASIDFKYIYKIPPLERPPIDYLYFGLRIEEIENYDPDNRLIEKSIFSYMRPDEPTRSSGYRASSEPLRLSTERRVIRTFTNDSRAMLCDYEQTTYKYYYNKPITGIYPDGVSYEYVQIKKEKEDKTSNGTVQYRFKKANDFDYGTDVPKVSASEQRGTLLQENIYDSHHKLAESINYFYKNDNRINKESTGFKLIKYLDATQAGNCRGDMEYTTQDMYIPVNYSYYSIWSRPDSIVKHTYIDNKSFIKNKIEYAYDDIISCLPTKVTESTSINKNNKITNNKYPSQLADAVSKKMTDRNMINEFVIKENLIDNTLISRQTNKFSIKLLDKENQEWFSNKDLACLDSVVIQYGTSLPVTKLKVPVYDNFNNILQYETTAKLPHTYLWGYNYKYPIAEIKNATYSQVVQKLTQALIDRVAEAAVPADEDLQKIKNLTTSIPTGLITTYTYKPLVGITTMTDPRGVTTYYDYDSFGRLKEVYVKEAPTSPKRVIESYDYKYANQ